MHQAGQRPYGKEASFAPFVRNTASRSWQIQLTIFEKYCMDSWMVEEHEWICFLRPIEPSKKSTPPSQHSFRAKTRHQASYPHPEHTVSHIHWLHFNEHSLESFEIKFFWQAHFKRNNYLLVHKNWINCWITSYISQRTIFTNPTLSKGQNVLFKVHLNLDWLREGIQ